MFNLFKKERCKSGFKRVGDRCMKRQSIPKHTPEKPETMCLLNGKTFCGNDKPLKPPIGYTGGKSKLSNAIIKKIPPHKTYVEPFIGGGGYIFKETIG